MKLVLINFYHNILKQKLVFMEMNRNMNKLYFNPQFLRLFILLSIIGLLGFGYFLQPCKRLRALPLCITQRFFFF